MINRNEFLVAGSVTGRMLSPLNQALVERGCQVQLATLKNGSVLISLDMGDPIAAKQIYDLATEELKTTGSLNIQFGPKR